MKRIYYATGSVVTGDEIAAAVVRYAEALAARDSSDTVDIPILLDSGHIDRAQLLIGPASQLVVVTEETEREEPHDQEAIARISELAGRLQSPRPQPSDDAVATDYGFDYENDNDAEQADDRA